MDSLELVRRLYEGDVDLDALQKDLDEGSREELRHLIEARDALAELPRRKPSAGVIDAVVADGVRSTERRRPALTLLVFNKTMQRLAAAAIVVVAVGVGYLALRTQSALPLQKEKFETVSPAAPVGGQNAPVVAESSEFAAQGKAGASTTADEMEPAPTEEFRGRDAEVPASRQMTRSGAIANKENQEFSRFDAFQSLADSKPAPFDTVVGMESDDAREPMAWDDEEEALRTFFWQVRALDGRSPDDKWEEAVPLEGSFEHLDRQQPANDRWLQTGSQR